MTNGAVNGVTDEKMDLNWTDSAFSPPDLIRADWLIRGAAAQVTGLSLSMPTLRCYV
jgi:hypothetical protein